MNLRKLTVLVFYTMLLIGSSIPEASTSEQQILIEELLFSSADISLTSGNGLTLLGSGLALSDDYDSSSYTSASILAPIPFNAIVPQWRADSPNSEGIEIYLRTSQNGDDWGSWQESHHSEDWTLAEDEDVVGDMIVVPADDSRHTFAQYKIVFNRNEKLSQPILRELKLVFIDSTAGPTVEEMIAQQEYLDGRQESTRSVQVSEAGSYQKPSIISRDVWCTDPRCDYSDGFEYYPVTHLILHHTVTTSNGDSAATVRAIWAYHTVTRGWGDIGYNYLADTAGVIYEGHLGGDDVVGIHAGNANTGSMAVSLIGNFSDADPPQPMLEAAIGMFSWKADQNDIDVFDASNALPNVPWGLPHIMGHRDVYGTTQCPGDHAHRLIPAIRDEVAARIGLTSPHIYVDELSSAFTKSTANWYTPIYQCGHNVHAWYTWSTTNPDEAANWGEWRPEVPENGRYKIEAYVPYCNTGRSESSGANYTITHANGSSSVTVDQNSQVGLWISLGEYDLSTGNSTVIRLSDLTTTDDGLGIWFDAIRLLKVGVAPAALNQSPADKSWSKERQVLFEWHIENPEQVTKTILQIAADDQFQNIISTKEWPSVVESVPHTFDQDYNLLFWRVILITQSGSEYASSPFRFGIDATPPVSVVTSLDWLDWIQKYRLSWQGFDNLTGIAGYTIEYRLVNGGGNSWLPLLVQSEQTAALFSAPDANAVYEFRSQAVDSLGNLEAAHETADIDTQQAISHSHAIILPVIRTD